jgi:drug/metabolite transporter (DMT)-like permease
MQEHRTQSPAPWLGLFLAAIWAAGDLVSKAAVEAWLMARPSAQQTLAPYLDLTLSHNRGVTFGLFNAAGTSSLLILGLTGAIAAVLAVLILRGRRPVPTLCLGLVLGGLGVSLVLLRNVIEREAELAMLSALGWPRRRVESLLLVEHALLLVAGVAVGGVSAVVAAWRGRWCCGGWAGGTAGGTGAGRGLAAGTQRGSGAPGVASPPAGWLS